MNTMIPTRSRADEIRECLLALTSLVPIVEIARHGYVIYEYTDPQTGERHLLDEAATHRFAKLVCSFVDDLSITADTDPWDEKRWCVYMDERRQVPKDELRKTAIFPMPAAGNNSGLTTYGAAAMAREAEEWLFDMFPNRSFKAIVGGETSEEWSWHLRHGCRLMTAQERRARDRIVEDLHHVQEPSWWEEEWYCDDE